MLRRRWEYSANRRCAFPSPAPPGRTLGVAGACLHPAHLARAV